MNSERLKRIFDKSACLTPKQMKGYVSGTMVNEEAYAVEVHLLSCPMCRDAIDAMYEHKDSGVLNEIVKLDTKFLEGHSGFTNPESIPTTVSSQPKMSLPKPKKKVEVDVKVWWRIGAVAAVVVAGLAIAWFVRNSADMAPEEHMAQELSEPEQQQTPEVNNTPPETVPGDTASLAATVMDTPVTEPVVASAEKEVMEQEPVKEDVVAKKKEAEAAMVADIATKKPEKDIATNTALTSGEQPLKGLDNKKEPEVAVSADKKLVKEVKQESTAAEDEYAVAKRLGNSYTPAAEEKKPEPPPPPPKATAPAGASESVKEATELYNNKKYRKALGLYQKEMYNTRSANRNEATLMAARCHMALHEKMQARTLLNSLVRDNAPQKAEAEKLLKQME